MRVRADEEPGRDPVVALRSRVTPGGDMHKTRRRFLLVGLATMAVSAGPLWPSVQAGASGRGTTTAVTTVELATYHGNSERQGYTATGIAITTTNAAKIRASWMYSAGGNTISDQAVVYDGIAYWGDWSGDEHATSASGKNLWSTSIGQTNDQQCSPNPVGVASSATVGTVNGQLYVITGGGASTSSSSTPRRERSCGTSASPRRRPVLFGARRPCTGGASTSACRLTGTARSSPAPW